MLQKQFDFVIESIKTSDTEGFNGQLIVRPTSEMLEANNALVKHIEAAFKAANPTANRLPSFAVVNNGKGFLNIKLANIKEMSAAIGLSEFQTHGLLNVGKGVRVECVATAYLPKDNVVDSQGVQVFDRETGKPIMANDPHINLSFVDIDASSMQLNPVQKMALQFAIENPTKITDVWGEKALSKNQKAAMSGQVKQNNNDFSSNAPKGALPESAKPKTEAEIQALAEAVDAAEAALAALQPNAKASVRTKLESDFAKAKAALELATA